MRICPPVLQQASLLQNAPVSYPQHAENSPRRAVCKQYVAANGQTIRNDHVTHSRCWCAWWCVCVLRVQCCSSVFRSLATVDKTVEKCHLELNDRDSRLVFKLHCKYGMSHSIDPFARNCCCHLYISKIRLGNTLLCGHRVKLSTRGQVSCFC